MLPGDRLASSPRVRRWLAGHGQLRRIVWPTTDEALTRRRDGAIAVDAVYRALTGLVLPEADRAALLGRAKRGLGFDALTSEIQSDTVAATRLTGLASAALRQQMDRDFSSDDPGAGRSEPRAALLHIAKTGGTSLSDLLRLWVGPARARVGVPLDDLVLMPRPLLGHLRAVSGHFPFEALGLIPPSFQTITVLRDPVGRTVSHFHELRRRDMLHADLSLDEFLAADAYDVPSGNYQARALAHRIDLADAWIGYSPAVSYGRAGGDEHEPYPLQALFDSTPLALDEQGLLDQAALNLSALDHVGVIDDLDGLAARIGRVFGFDRVVVPHLNRTASTERPDLPGHLRRRIEERTAVDRALYDQAVEINRAQSQ